MPLQQRTTDYHSHILPGIDDGAVDMADSIRMARLLFETGYRTVYCTPHLIRGMYEVTKGEVMLVRDRLQEELEREGIGIRLLAGREYYLDEFLPELLRDPQPLENTKDIMIEIPSHAATDMVKQTLFEVSRKGYRPIIAHPERCKLLEPLHTGVSTHSNWQFWKRHNRTGDTDELEDNGLLLYLRQLGCGFQANLGSLRGQYGSQVKANARYFEKNNIYTHAGTDAHASDTITSILGII